MPGACGPLGVNRSLRLGLAGALLCILTSAQRARGGSWVLGAQGPWFQLLLLFPGAGRRSWNACPALYRGTGACGVSELSALCFRAARDPRPWSWISPGGDDLWDGCVAALAYFPILGMVLECPRAQGRGQQPAAAMGPVRTPSWGHPLPGDIPLLPEGPRRAPPQARGEGMEPKPCVHLKPFFSVLVDSFWCCLSGEGP